MRWTDYVHAVPIEQLLSAVKSSIHKEIMREAEKRYNIICEDIAKQIANGMTSVSGKTMQGNKLHITGSEVNGILRKLDDGQRQELMERAGIGIAYYVIMLTAVRMRSNFFASRSMMILSAPS